MTIEVKSMPRTGRLIAALQQGQAHEKAAYVFMGLLCAYAIVRGLRGAAARPFWFDEFFTLTIAGQASVREMWTELRRGFDTQPPLFYLIERVALSIPVKKEITLRLPSILAFSGILICVFSYVRRRSGEVIACLCALLLLCTSLFHTYLIDARPYSMVIACIAFAMVCYQRLPSRGWTVLFGLSLVLAESLHYYAVFTMIPFWFAEAMEFLKTRRFRWPIWLALVCGTLPLFVSLQLLLRSKAFYGAHFFAPPVFSRVKEYYGSYFSVDRELGIALLVVSVTAIAWSYFGSRTGAQDSSVSGESGAAVGTLLLGVNLLPMITYVLVRMLHGGMLDRYTLATTIGVILGIACVLSILPVRAVVLFALFVFCIVGLREQAFWRLSGWDPLTHDTPIGETKEFAQIQDLVESGGHPDLPVVFDQEVLYLQIVHYCSPDWTRRLVFLTDEGRELSFDRSDTAVRIMKSFQDFFPVRLADYTQFTTQHSEFLLYAEPEGWILWSLRHEGASAQILEGKGARWLYLVRMNEAARVSGKSSSPGR